MVPMDTAALAASPLLSEEGRRRALERPDLRERKGGDDESIASFMTSNFGEEAYQLLIEPLVGGIHAADASLLSRDAILPKPGRADNQGSTAEQGRAAGSGSADRAPFLSFPRGMAELVRALEERLKGVTISRGTRVESAHRRGTAFLVEVSGGASHEADALIVTVPAHEAARLLAPIDPTLNEMLGLIPFASTVVIHLAYRRADVPHGLDGYGYLIPAVEQSDLVACTWSSQKWEGRAPSDHVLLRLMAGRFGRRDVPGRPDQELFELARAELSATLGITADPVLRRLHRWDRGMPQYTVGHLRRTLAIVERVQAFPGLFLAGSSYEGVGIPQCVESGARAAAAALRHIDGQKEEQPWHRNRP
jgi:oxygen-dependent protoporphyrinogen oxidase